MFNGMTIEEQKTWWLDKAKKALSSFEMDSASIEWLAYTHHAVFRIGSTHTLKLSLSEYSDQLVSEFNFLRDIASTGILVAQPLHHQVFEDFTAILLTYLEGDSPNPDFVSDDEMFTIGAFIGRFHQVEISNRHAIKSLDWDGLFSDSGIYQPSDENMQVFTDEQLSIMDTVASKVKLAMDELGKDGGEFGLIHGDLLLKNILFHEGNVRALDFEYCGWGYYLYDLTPILWQLKPQDRYSQLEQALWAGYNSIRALTPQHRELLETFIAGRQVASMRWIAANQQNPYVVGKVDTILGQRTAQLSGFLKTGKLKRD